MKVLGLYAKNVLRLKEVQIKPDGTMVPISGRNGQGKSSVLNCLWLALKAASAKKVMPEIIRHGEERAQIILDIGEYTILRKFKKEPSGEVTTSLSVEEADGTPVRRPQSFLDGLISSVSFDPTEFELMSPRDRRACLVDVFGLSVDQFDEEIDTIKEERKGINAELKLVKGQLSAIAAPQEDDPTEEKSAADLINEMHQLNDLSRQRIEAVNQAAALKQRVKNLEAELETARSDLDRAKAKIAQIPEDIETRVEAKRTELETAETRNERARAVKQYHELSDRAAVLTEEVRSKNNAIELKKIERDEEVEKATLPVDGLEITVDGILFDGVPFDQKSQAERIKISMAVAMAANPQLRVIRIANGSLFDSENLALIQDLAEENDYQVWIELVDDSGSVGIHIEDGEVVAVNS